MSKRPPISDQATIAVILPCYNEGHTIKDVVSAFKKRLPRATVYVFDNNSSDETASEALAAGAEVYSVKMQGKGLGFCLKSAGQRGKRLHETP